MAASYDSVPPSTVAMSPTETKVFPSASVARTTSDEPAGETNVAGGAGAAKPDHAAARAARRARRGRRAGRITRRDYERGEPVGRERDAGKDGRRGSATLGAKSADEALRESSIVARMRSSSRATTSAAIAGGTSP